MRRKKAVTWLIGLLITGVACGMILLIRPHERLLLSRGSLIAGHDQFDTYNWQSNRSMLLFYKRPEYPRRWSIEKVNMLTGQQTPYPALAKQLEPKNTAVWDFETSLDGKWLLWKLVKEDIEGVHVTGMLASLQTGQVDHFPVGWTSGIVTSLHELHWMADSKHWAELDFPQGWGMTSGKRLGPGTTILRGVNMPRQARRLTIRADWNLDEFANIQVLSEAQVVATTFPAYQQSIQYGRPLELVQTGLIDNASPTRRRPLPLPDGTQIVCDIVFSPQGDRIAIAAVVDPPSFWLDTVHRLHLPIRVAPHPQVGIWIVAIDGSQNRLVGQVTPERDNTENASYPYEMPRDLRWSPDGKQLGFVYKERLYRVPTD